MLSGLRGPYFATGFVCCSERIQPATKSSDQRTLQLFVTDSSLCEVYSRCWSGVLKRRIWSSIGGILRLRLGKRHQWQAIDERLHSVSIWRHSGLIDAKAASNGSVLNRGRVCGAVHGCHLDVGIVWRSRRYYQGIRGVLREWSIPLRVAKEPRDSRRLKHVDIKFNFIRELVQRGDTVIKYIPSEERQLADWMTKGLSAVAFRRLLEEIIIRYSRN